MVGSDGVADRVVVFEGGLGPLRDARCKSQNALRNKAKMYRPSASVEDRILILNTQWKTRQERGKGGQGQMGQVARRRQRHGR